MLKSRATWLRLAAAVFLSSLLWLLVTLSKTYELTIECPVVFTNVPQKSIFNQQLPTSVQISVMGTGQQLLFPSLRKKQDTLYLPIVNASVTKGYIPMQHYASAIRRNLAYVQNVVKIRPDTVFLDLTEPFSKRLAISPNIALKLRDDFLPTKKIELNPDSLWFTGSQRDLAYLSTWKTQKTVIDLQGYHESSSTQNLDPFELSLDDLQAIELVKPIKRKVLIEKQHGVFCDVDEVEAVIYVDKFTQATCWADVEVINAPTDHQVRLIPSRVLISFQVPFNQYEKIIAKNFRLQVNYEDLQPEGKQVVPTLIGKPDFISHFWFEPKSVKYVVRSL